MAKARRKRDETELRNPEAKKNVSADHASTEDAGLSSEASIRVHIFTHGPPPGRSTRSDGEDFKR